MYSRPHSLLYGHGRRTETILLGDRRPIGQSWSDWADWTLFRCGCIMRYLTVSLATYLLAMLLATSAARADQADCWQAARNPDLAVQACTDLIRRFPSDARYYHARGVAYAWKKD